MRRERVIAAVEVVAAVLLAVAAVASWRNGLVHTSYAAQGDLPAFESVRYLGPWLVSAVALATLAGLAVIDAVARLSRAQSLQF